MRDGQALSYRDLQEAVAKALSDAGVSQAQVARDLGVTRGAVSRAAKEAGETLSRLQMRIIEHLTSYRVEKKTIFRIRKEGG